MTVVVLYETMFYLSIQIQIQNPYNASTEVHRRLCFSAPESVLISRTRLCRIVTLRFW